MSTRITVVVGTGGDLWLDGHVRPILGGAPFAGWPTPARRRSSWRGRHAVRRRTTVTRRTGAAAQAARRLGVRATDYGWILRAQARAARLDDPTRWGHGTDTPVLLLPGIYETWAVLEPLATSLHEAGHPVHTVPALGFHAGGLADCALLVARRILELDLHRVVLVAHSKGGLVGKVVLGDPSVADRVAGLVAVNTPFAGSALGYVFPTRAVRALLPSSPTIRALSALVEVNPRIASLSASFDPHVPGGGALPGAVTIVLPVEGHFRPLGDHRVHAAVLDQVARLARAWRSDPAST